MFQVYIDAEKDRFEKAILQFRQELAKVRTGRASTSLLDGITVDAYGSKMPLDQLATLHIPEPRTITVSPWDKGMTGPIETALRESDLGLSPTVDGAVIRLNLPQLTEERRLELVKIVGKKTEETRIIIRRIREDIMDALQKAEKTGEISEDDKFSGKETLQKIVDGYNETVEDIRKKKEGEVKTV